MKMIVGICLSLAALGAVTQPLPPEAASAAASTRQPRQPRAVPPTPPGLSEHDARLWANLHANAGWVKSVQVIGYVDPAILATKKVAITVDGKVYNVEGDFVPNRSPKPSSIRRWEGAGPGAEATFWIDTAASEVSGTINLGGRRFGVNGPFLVELIGPGADFSDGTPKNPLTPASGAQR
jgi:hypothetical protein